MIHEYLVHQHHAAIAKELANAVMEFKETEEAFLAGMCDESTWHGSTFRMNALIDVARVLNLPLAQYLCAFPNPPINRRREAIALMENNDFSAEDCARALEQTLYLCNKSE